MDSKLKANLRNFLTLFTVINLFLVGGSLTGCSGARKKNDLSAEDLRSKVIALVDIDGGTEEDSKAGKLQLEVSLVNEIISQGHFQLVDRGTVREHQVDHPTQADWPALGKELKADYLLSVNLQEVRIDTRQGYDAAEEEDSLLSAEHRTDRDTKWRKLHKVKAHTGTMTARFLFFDVSRGEITMERTVEAKQTFNSRDGDLPRKMKMIENLCTEVSHKFFESFEAE